MSQYAIDGCTPADIESGIAAQNSLIRTEVIESAMMNPYSNLFLGGTMEAHIGEDLITTVPGRTVMNQSMTQPEVIRTINTCGQQGPTAEFGSTNYTARMESIRGRGPDLCVKQQFHAVENALEAMIRQMRRGITELMAADARRILLSLSGHKFVAYDASVPFFDKLTGGEREISTAFASLGVPNASMPHKALVRLMTYLMETSDVERFGQGDGAYAVYIGSSESIERMRDESGLRTETLAYIQGSDAAAKAAMRRYTFAQYPYRGIRTAIDERPLRFNNVDGNNFPILVEPYEEVATDNGTEWRITDAWKNAGYEVSFLVFANTFKRVVPQALTREGDATWPAQFVMGQMQWKNLQSYNCNEYGDTGHFIYEVIRMWQPVMPWAVCPILQKRCEPDDGFQACTGVSQAGD